MAKAFRCDRCLEFEDHEPVLRVTLRTVEPPVKETTKELCAPCLAGLNEWIDTPSRQADR